MTPILNRFTYWLECRLRRRVIIRMVSLDLTADDCVFIASVVHFASKPPIALLMARPSEVP